MEPPDGPFKGCLVSRVPHKTSRTPSRGQAPRPEGPPLQSSSLSSPLKKFSLSRPSVGRRPPTVDLDSGRLSLKLGFRATNTLGKIHATIRG